MYLSGHGMQELCLLQQARKPLQGVLWEYLNRKGSVVLTTVESVTNNPVLWFSEEYKGKTLYVLDHDSSCDERVYANLLTFFGRVVVVECIDPEEEDKADWVDMDDPREFLYSTMIYPDVEEVEMAEDVPMIDYADIFRVVSEHAKANVIFFSQSEFANYEMLRMAALTNLDYQVVVNMVPVIVRDPTAVGIFEENEDMETQRFFIPNIAFHTSEYEPRSGLMILRFPGSHLS